MLNSLLKPIGHVMVLQTLVASEVITSLVLFCLNGSLAFKSYATCQTTEMDDNDSRNVMFNVVRKHDSSLTNKKRPFNVMLTFM